MRGLVVILFLLVTGTLSPCFAAGPSDAVAQLQWLDNADPIMDAHAAMAKGDNRLKAVAGFTISVPGVPSQKENEYRERYGVAVISGTSDALESKEYARLNRLAIRYAEQYNGEVIKSVQK